MEKIVDCDAVILDKIPPIEWNKCVVDWNDPFGIYQEDFRPFPPPGKMLRYPITPGFSYITAWPFPRQSPTLTIKIIDFPERAGPAVNARGIQQRTPVVRFAPREN